MSEPSKLSGQIIDLIVKSDVDERDAFLALVEVLTNLDSHGVFDSAPQYVRSALDDFVRALTDGPNESDWCRVVLQAAERFKTRTGFTVMKRGQKAARDDDMEATDGR